QHATSIAPADANSYFLDTGEDDHTIGLVKDILRQVPSNQLLQHISRVGNSSFFFLLSKYRESDRQTEGTHHHTFFHFFSFHYRGRTLLALLYRSGIPVN